MKRLFLSNLATVKNQGLNKYERLKSRKQIDILFKSKQGVFAHPVRYAWGKGREDQLAPVEMMVSVSKRNFKRAVDRNRIKRLMREVYRKNKQVLYEFLQDKDLKISLALVFVAKVMPDYKSIEKSVLKAMKRIIEEIEQNGVR